MKFPKYVLCASGSATTPRVDAIIGSDDEDRAIEQAQAIAAKLSLAGYFAFDMFEVSPEGDKFFVGFRVDQPAPEVRVCRR